MAQRTKSPEEEKEDEWLAKAKARLSFFPVPSQEEKDEAISLGRFGEIGDDERRIEELRGSGRQEFDEIVGRRAGVLQDLEPEGPVQPYQEPALQSAKNLGKGMIDVLTSPLDTISNLKGKSSPQTHPTNGKPILNNPDGSISTEESITVEVEEINGGKPTNIPTIWDGERLSGYDAVGRAISSGQKFPSFESIDEAEASAVKRSEMLGQAMDTGFTPKDPNPRHGTRGFTPPREYRSGVVPTPEETNFTGAFKSTGAEAAKGFPGLLKLPKVLGGHAREIMGAMDDISERHGLEKIEPPSIPYFKEGAEALSKTGQAGIEGIEEWMSNDPDIQSYREALESGDAAFLEKVAGQIGPTVTSAVLSLVSPMLATSYFYGLNDEEVRAQVRERGGDQEAEDRASLRYTWMVSALDMAGLDVILKKVPSGRGFLKHLMGYAEAALGEAVTEPLQDIIADVGGQWEARDTRESPQEFFNRLEADIPRLTENAIETAKISGFIGGSTHALSHLEKKTDPAIPPDDPSMFSEKQGPRLDPEDKGWDWSSPRDSWSKGQRDHWDRGKRHGEVLKGRSNKYGHDSLSDQEKDHLKQYEEWLSSQGDVGGEAPAQPLHELEGPEAQVDQKSKDDTDLFNRIDEDRRRQKREEKSESTKEQPKERRLTDNQDIARQILNGYTRKEDGFASTPAEALTDKQEDHRQKIINSFDSEEALKKVLHEDHFPEKEEAKKDPTPEELLGEDAERKDKTRELEKKDRKPTPERKTKKKPLGGDATKDSLASFVRKEGGLNYDAEALKGELDRLGKKENVHGIVRKNKTGRTIDAMLERAREEGYFEDDATPADFLTALEDDLFGARKYSTAKEFSEKEISDIPVPDDVKDGPRKMVVAGDLDLEVGDSFTIDGEDFNVEGLNADGDMIIKDGLQYEVDPFDMLPEPDKGSVKKGEKKKDAEDFALTPEETKKEKPKKKEEPKTIEMFKGSETMQVGIKPKIAAEPDAGEFFSKPTETDAEKQKALLPDETEDRKPTDKEDYDTFMDRLDEAHDKKVKDISEKDEGLEKEIKDLQNRLHVEENAVIRKGMIAEIKALKDKKGHQKPDIQEETETINDIIEESDKKKSESKKKEEPKKPNKAVHKLRTVATRMREKSQEGLNSPSLRNTPKRAREGASRDDDLRANIALADTLDNIANAIDSGEAQHLAKMTSKSQLEELIRLSRNATYRAERGNQKFGKVDYRRPFKESDLAFVEIPDMALDSGALKSLADTVAGFKGGKKLAEHLRMNTARIPVDLAERVFSFLKKNKETYSGWQLRDALATTKRLVSMGIQDLKQLKQAINELSKYQGKKIEEDPIKVLERGLVGNKIPSYFNTSETVVKDMIEKAEIEKGMKVLEPSAGKGDIADKLRDEAGKVDVIEVNGTLREILQAKKHNLIDSDFMEFEGTGYDRIVMNPPFEKRQDVDHVMRAYDKLSPGGRIVAIMGEGPFFGSDKKASDFREWLDGKGYSEKLPQDSFKTADRPTGVNARMVIIDKPSSTQPATPEALSKEAQKIKDQLRKSRDKKKVPTPEQTEKKKEEKKVKPKTEEKKVPKMEGTGKALRRYYEMSKDRIENAKGTKALDDILKATTRSDLMDVELDKDATPGTRRFVDAVRSQLKTFSEIYGKSHGAGRRRWQKSPKEILQGIFSESKDTDIQVNDVKLEAYRYITAVEKLAEALTGAKNVDDASQRLRDFFFGADFEGRTIENIRRKIKGLDESGEYVAKYTGDRDKAIEEIFSRYIYRQHYPMLKHYMETGEFSEETKKYSINNTHYSSADTPAGKDVAVVMGGEYSSLPAQMMKPDSYWLQAAKADEKVEYTANTKKKAIRREKLDRIERDNLPDYRKGKDVTAQDLKDTFGFGDVHYGGYVKGKERQDHTNNSYDAFMDLSKRLDVDPKQMGLNGTLHYAIGVLGQGGRFAATYHPKYPHAGGYVTAINLTRKNGDGSIAHEWGHALDFFLRKKNPDLGDLVNGLKYKYGRSVVDDNIDRVLRRGSYWRDIGPGNTKGNLTRILESYRVKPEARSYYKNARAMENVKSKPYWSNDREMFARAWEAYIFDTLDGSSPYLVNDFVQEGKIKKPAYKGTPYPEGDDRADIAGMMSEFLENIAWTKKGPDLNHSFELNRKEKEDVEKYRLEKVDKIDDMIEAYEKERIQKALDLKERQRKEKKERERDLKKKDDTKDEPKKKDGLFDNLSDEDMDSLFDDSVDENPPPDTDVPTQKDSPPKKKGLRKDYRKEKSKEGDKVDDEPSLSSLASDFKDAGVEGIGEALKGLHDIFGGGRIKTFPSGLDQEAYEKAKPHFISAYRATLEAGRSAREFVRVLVKAFGAKIRPYLIHFMKEARDGQIAGLDAHGPGHGQADAGTDGGKSSGERPGLITANEGDIPETGNYVSSYGNNLDVAQRIGSNLAIENFLLNGRPGFLLADGTGVGKTRQILVIAEEMAKSLEKPALIITDSKQVIEGSFAKDSKSLGIPIEGGNIEIGTYYSLAKGLVGEGDYSVVIFDEAHNLKNTDSTKTSASEEIKADFRLFATATPMDKPTAATYFLSKITGKSQETIMDEVGISVEEYVDQFGNDKKRTVLSKGVSWAKVMDNIIKLRDEAVKYGSLVRRAYPFYGKVDVLEMDLSETEERTQDRVELYWQNRIKNSRGRAKKRTAAGLRIGELSRWLEARKVDKVEKLIQEDIASGRRVVVIAEGVNDTIIKALSSGIEGTPSWKPYTEKGFLNELASRLDDLKIPYGKVFGTGKKGEEVDKFQTDKVRVVIATAKSGGTGINLDDTFGDRPRSMYVVTSNFSGDVFQQVLGRVSRKMTKSASIVKMLNFNSGISDIRRKEILDRKIQTLEAIQGGTDIDKAEGFESKDHTDRPVGSVQFSPAERPSEKPRTFFSKLTKAITDKMPRKASPQQIAGIIKGAGIKQDEIKWSAIQDFLEKQKGGVSKQDVLDYLAQNEVQIEEVEKGDRQNLSSEEAEELMSLDDGQRLGELNNIQYNRLLDLRRKAKETNDVSTKFSAYTLPGGENYRELLLRMPPKYKIKELPSDAKVIKKLKDLYFVQIPSMTRQYIGSGKTREAAIADALETLNVTIKATKNVSTFKSPHFPDDSNILAHIRFNDRTDAQGNRILFIEEIQSDWHQAGKKKGYNVPVDTKGWSIRENGDGNWDILDPNGDIMEVETSEQEAQNVMEQFSQGDAAADRSMVGTVPDAPFKKTWHELALKRMLRYAAENGYDKLAWTTGEQQADRYDLSKHINKISYNPETNMLAAWGKDDYVVIDQHVEKGDIGDHIGKEAAKKLLATTPKSLVATDKLRPPVHSLSGLELSVGGEGMRAFYDKMIPQFLSKYGKKWGARVQTTAMNFTQDEDIMNGITGEYDYKYHGPERTQEFVDKARSKIKNDRGLLMVANSVHDSMDHIGFRRAMEKYSAGYMGQHFVDLMGGRMQETEIIRTNPSIPITPSMKKSVLGEGQPLFRPTHGRANFTVTQIKDIITDIQRIIAPGGKVLLSRELKADLAQNQKAAQAWSLGKDGIVKLAGTHQRVVLNNGEFSSLIRLSMADMKATTPYHEAWHSIESLLLNDNELKVMRTAFPDKGGVAGKEHSADAFAEWVEGKKAPSSAVKRIFQKIKDFFSRLRNALKGRGFNSVESIFGKAYSGDMKKRGSRQQRAEDLTQFSPAEKEIGQEFDINPETRMELLRRLAQDKMHRLLKIQTETAKQGGVLNDEINAYLKEELHTGKIEDKIDRLWDRVVKPLLEDIRTSGIGLEDLENFLYAKHAPERNTQIAKINPDMQEGGSGMTDADAQDILDGFESDGRTEQLEGLSKQVYKINKMGRYIIRTEGLESEEAIDKWEETYKNYVPLKGTTKPQPPGRGIGKGFDIRGRESKRALGRSSRATDILANTVSQVEDTIIRSEKNKVGQAFLKFVQANPNPELWKVSKVKFAPRLSKEGEVVTAPDPKYKYQDNVLSVKVDGRQFLIEILDPGLAEGMKNLGNSNQNRVVQFFSKVNRYLAMINTAFTPEFIISNFQRDMQTALINLSGEQSAKLAARVARDTPKAIAGVYNATVGKGNKPWAKTYAQYKRDGGKIGFFGLEDIEAKRKRLKHLINKHNKGVGQAAENAVKALGDYIMAVNGAVENGVRLSAYKNAIDAGMTRERAASLAKNLTVNFNRKGAWGQAMNSMYLFYNAGIQGTTRMLFQAMKHKKVRKIALGIMATGFIMDAINRSIDGDDDEYEKIHDFVKETNIVLMKGADGKYLKWKMPFGYNIFWYLGTLGSELMHGRPVSEVAVNAFKATMNAFNPLGGEAGLVQMASPTLTDPFVQVATNENFFGGDIKPRQDQYGPRKPESQLYWSSTRPMSKSVAQTLNEITGGDEVVSGAIDVSPEVLDHFFDFATGGAGAFSSRSVNYIKSVLEGKPTEVRQIPFVRRVVGQPRKKYDYYRFRDNFDKVRAVDLRIKKFKENDDSAGLKRFESRHQKEIKALSRAKAANKQMRRLRKQVKDAEKRNVSQKVKQGIIDKAEEDMKREAIKFNRYYEKKSVILPDHGKKTGNKTNIDALRDLMLTR